MINLPLDLGTFQDIEQKSLNLATLRLYDRALAATSCGIAIADARQPDFPLIYCNPAFEKMTGYRREEVLGRNCRFLQGQDTDRAAVEQIRAALRAGRECQVTLKNYRKDGTPFWNDLILSPVQDEWGELAYYVGIQTDITQRRQAEETQRLMQFSIDRAADAALYLSSEGRLLYVNQAASRLLGYSREDLLALRIGDIAPAYSPTSWQKHWQQLQEQGNLTLETELITQQGTKIFVEFTENFLSFNGQDYNCTFVRDISDRKRAEANLRSHIKREKLASKIANRIRQSFDLDRVLNTAAREVRKVLAADRVVLYRFCTTGENSQPQHWKGKAIVESVGEGWAPIVGTDVRENCLQANSIPCYQKGYTRAIEDIYNADLTPSHIARLEQFQVRATLTVPIFQKARLWGLLIVHNCSEARPWHKSEIELLKRLSVQLAIAIRQAALFEQLESELQERSRTEAALRQSETQLKTALHELQQTQTQLVQTEKMSSLGQLVAGVAHEINNPISFISGNLTFVSEYARALLELLQLYRQHYPQPPAAIQTKAEDMDCDFVTQDFPKLLNSMKMGTERIEKIVQSLRNFSRLDEADRKPVDLHEGLDNTLLILQGHLKQAKHPIQIVKTYGQIPQVECYASLLNQVFMNILVNAIDALQESGVQSQNSGEQPTITIRTETIQSHSILTQECDSGMSEITTEQVLSHPKSNWVVIRIKDNGPGISEGVQPYIFDPFFTTKPVGQGTGLGLSVSYQIVVEKHKGRIECCSSGWGTEFAIAIPVER
jgi:two-component system, NtrC family, sensor kinase